MCPKRCGSLRGSAGTCVAPPLCREAYPGVLREVAGNAVEVRRLLGSAVSVGKSIGNMVAPSVSGTLGRERRVKVEKKMEDLEEV